MADKTIRQFITSKRARTAYVRRVIDSLGSTVRAAWAISEASGRNVSQSDVCRAKKVGTIPFAWCEGLRRIVPDFNPFAVRRDYDYEMHRAKVRAEFRAQRDEVPA